MSLSAAVSNPLPGRESIPEIPPFLVFDVFAVVARAAEIDLVLNPDERSAEVCTVKAIAPFFEALYGVGSAGGDLTMAVVWTVPEDAESFADFIPRSIWGARQQSSDFYVRCVKYWNEAIDVVTGARGNERRWKRRATKPGLAKAERTMEKLATALELAGRAVGPDRIHASARHQEDAVRYLAYYHVVDVWRRQGIAVRAIESYELRPEMERSWADMSVDALVEAVVLSDRTSLGALDRELTTPTVFFDWAAKTAAEAGCHHRNPRTIRNALRMVGVIQKSESQKGRTSGPSLWLRRLRERAQAGGWAGEDGLVAKWGQGFGESPKESVRHHRP